MQSPRCHSKLSPGSPGGWSAPLVPSGDLFTKLPVFSVLSCFPLPYHVSWDHLPNKSLAQRSLSQHWLPGKPKPRHEVIVRLRFYVKGLGTGLASSKVRSLSDAILTLGWAGFAGEVGFGESWEGSGWKGAGRRMVPRQEERAPPIWWEGRGGRRVGEGLAKVTHPRKTEIITLLNSPFLRGGR